MDDAELVDGLQRGEAFYKLALLERYQDRLSEFVLRFRRLDEVDAENVATEVLYQLAFEPSIIDLSKGQGSLDGLVRRMAKNKAIDLDRKKQKSFSNRRVVSLDAHSDTPETIDDNDQITERRAWHGSEGPRYPVPPEVVSDAQQLAADLDLREEQWEHLRLRIEDKLQPKEMAEFLGITANNERVRWHRLRKKIECKWVKYPHLVKYAEEIGAGFPEAEIRSSGSEPQPE